jgi:hypothetical protein
MTVEELTDLLNQDRDGDFRHVENKLASRADLHAMILLDQLVPHSKDEPINEMVDAAEHDQIWLNVDVAKLAAVITPEQVIDLRRCGVFFDADVERLSLFV